MYSTPSHAGAIAELDRPAPQGDWLMFRQPRPEAAIRLLCFHHAGGAALAYRGWAARMPAFVEVCPVQLPGRGNRYREAPLRSAEALVPALLAALAPLLDKPLALFGHSMGAGLAFAVAAELERRGRAPLHLFAAGRRPPLAHYATALHRLGDAELADYLRALGGTPEIVFEEAELRETVFQLLRADLELNDGLLAAGPLARVPISALGGRDDGQVPLAALDAWRGLTLGRFERRLFDGGHFFVRDSETALIQHLSTTLTALLERR
ncbi:thioesterase II family protein [Chitinimonas koreensis]|uniref:thioesterase II family protein n=1 Tax=Chitinimonas koreensis TaxID=356302 RepID=UPI0003F91EBF|nr:alpha/beta fold hydrolase [Chitinimonas koreensis]QNM94645.1 thioesterase [Chitinimonas koreensis]